MRRRWSRCRVSRETRIGSGTRRNIKIHNNTWSNNRPTKLHGGTRIHREREKALNGLPAGITVVRATPKNGGGNGEFWRAPSPRPGGAPAPKIGGGALTTSSPSRRSAPGEAGTRQPLPRHGWRSRCGESVPTRVQCGFPGTAWTTTARASPSDSAELQFNFVHHLDAPPPTCKVATHTTAKPSPGGGNRRSLRGRWRPGFYAPIGGPSLRWRRGYDGVRRCVNGHHRLLSGGPLFPSQTLLSLVRTRCPLH